MRSVFLAVVCCLLASCGQSDIPTKSIEWRTLPDGSKTYIHDDDFATTVERCWPISGEFDCLFLSGLKLSMGISSWTGERRQTKVLAPGDLTFRGYSCSVDPSHPFGIRFQEHISAGAQQDLLSNMVSNNEPVGTPWTKVFITTFMRQNSVNDGGQYFSCEGLEHLVDTGSGSTLSTTAVTRQMVFD